MKLCILTGGSKGLGKALNHLYLSSDWQVKSLSRQPINAEDTTHVYCDFSEPEAEQKVEALFKTLSASHWSEIHLIHNVGRLGIIGPLAALKESTPRDWQQTLNVNLGSVFLVSGLFFKYFQSHQTTKTMAFVSSGAAHKNYAGWSLYCATKAAMERFALCVVEEQKPCAYPVTSVIINPGVMDTGMQAHIREADPEQFPHLERFLALKAEDALPSAETVARQCFDFLAQSPAPGVTFKVTH